MNTLTFVTNSFFIYNVSPVHIWNYNVLINVCLNGTCAVTSLGLVSAAMFNLTSVNEYHSAWEYYIAYCKKKKICVDSQKSHSSRFGNSCYREHATTN